jgi:hypothetical protein
MAYCDLWSIVLCYTKLLVSNVIGLHRALAEIHTIRGQLAHNAKFPGYGPALAATGAVLIIGVETVPRTRRIIRI